MSKFRQGIYKIMHSEKYIGTKLPVYRSSWELKFNKGLDYNNNCVKWASEYAKTEISYKQPDGTTHRYIPDYYVEMRLPEGQVRKFLVEVKPWNQSPGLSPPPKEPKNKTAKALRNFQASMKAYMINACKWSAAKDWCKKRGITFLVVTERDVPSFVGKKRRN
jgi:hypothetical protein